MAAPCRRADASRARSTGGSSLCVMSLSEQDDGSLIHVEHAMQQRALMISIQCQDSIELLLRLRRIAQAQIPQTHHIVTVDAATLVQVFVEHQEGGQRYGEVIHLHLVLKMRLPVIYELLEDLPRLGHLPQLPPRQPPMED